MNRSYEDFECDEDEFFLEKDHKREDRMIQSKKARGKRARRKEIKNKQWERSLHD